MKHLMWLIVLALTSACAGVAPHAASAQKTRTLLAFENANLVDVQRGTIVRGVTVVVEGERILKVSTRPVPLPHGSRRIDATGRYLMPGLWDMYNFALNGVQKDEPVLEMLVAHGVTGIRDMGSAMDLEEQRAVQDSVLEGKRPGPRIVYAGRRLSAPTARVTPALKVISNAREAAAAIKSLKEAGAEVVVGASSLTPGLTPIVAAEARKHGMSSSAWVVSGWIDAAGTGIQALDHPADLHRSTSVHRQEYFDFYARHQMKPLPPREQADPMFARMVDTPDRPYYLDTLRAIARNRIYVVTNFASFYFARRDWEFKDAARARFHTKAAAAEMAAGAKEGTYEGGAGPRVIEALGDMHRMGVKLLPGTGAGGLGRETPGALLHDELERFVLSGIRPGEALRAATISAATFLGRADKLGTITEGKLADIVLLSANPLSDIRNTRRIEAVMVNGRLYQRNELDSLLSSAAAFVAKRDSSEGPASN